MPSERVRASCSHFDILYRTLLIESTGENLGITLVFCQRDGKQCIPGRFPDGCPNGIGGGQRNLVKVKAGNVYKELGPVTVATGGPSDLID